MHILAIFHLKFSVWCVCGVSIIKGLTLKNEDVNICYVGDGHCSFLRIFVCNKKYISFVRRFSQIWLETKYEVQIFNHLKKKPKTKNPILEWWFLLSFFFIYGLWKPSIFIYEEKVVYLICLSH